MKPDLCAVALLLSCTSCTTLPSDLDMASGAASVINGVATTSQYIESTDGTRLAITIHRPTANGVPVSSALPVIVTQDRSALSPERLARIREYTDHGYVWIAQDRRGTGASFGVQTGFVNQLDAQDAKAVIDWSARQSFSSGRTVAMGCSNQGAWQYLAATLQPESLVAIAPACASPQIFDDGVAINGIPMIEVAEQPYAGECTRSVSGARPEGFVPPPPTPVDADSNGVLLRAAQEEQRCGAPMLGQYWLNMPRDGMNEFARTQPGLADTGMTKWREVPRFGSGGAADGRLVRCRGGRSDRRIPRMGRRIGDGAVASRQPSAERRQPDRCRTGPHLHHTALL